MPDFRRRCLVQVIAATPILSFLNTNGAVAETNKVTREFDISNYDKALLPREHGQLFEPNKTVIRRYPSREHCMQMAAFFNKSDGFLVIANDPSGGVADWEIRPGSKLRIHFYGDVPEVKTFHIKPTLEAAAAVYREWATKQSWVIRRQRQSRRLNFIVVASNSSFSLEKQHIQKVSESVSGSIGVWFTQWRRHPFDRMYPDYVARDAAQFSDLLSSLEKSNIIAMPYVNSMLWDDRLDAFKSVGPKVAVLSQDNSSVPYNSEMNFLRYACPKSAQWQKQIVDARNGIRDANSKPCSGVYLDMLAAVPPIFCFNSKHGHVSADAYAWQQGMRGLLQQVQGAVMVEGCAEVYIDLVDYLLMHLYTAQTDQVPLWKAVYGDLVQTVGWNIPSGISKPAMKDLVQQAAAFGVGASATPWMSAEPENGLFKRIQPAPPQPPGNVLLREM